MSGGLSDNAGMHTSTGRAALIRRRPAKDEILIEKAELEHPVLSQLRNVISSPSESLVGHLARGASPRLGPGTVLAAALLLDLAVKSASPHHRVPASGDS